MDQHRIRRQRWQVAAPDAATAFAVRSLLRERQESDVLPALDRAFSAVGVGDRLIHIPRLHIRLDLNLASLPGDVLAERLQEATLKALQAVLPEGGATSGRFSHEIVRDERLRQYVLTGQLPWFDAVSETSGIVAMLAEEALRWSSQPATTWQSLLAALPANVNAASAVFFRFLQLLAPAQLAAWRDFVEGLAATQSEMSATVAVRVLNALQSGRSRDAALRLQALSMVLLARRRVGSVAACRQLVVDVRAGCGALSENEGAQWQAIESWLTESGENGASSDSAPAADARSGLPDEVVGSRDHQPIGQTDSDAKPGLPVQACGLVLLHPFLHRLFCGLSWLGEDHPRGQPMPTQILPRAAALLHWLATGRDEPYEFELPFIKLLLGLSPADALPVAAGLLGPEEKAEGEALLGAAIAHWPALGQISLEGFRLAFLQRSGLLYVADDGWRLCPQAEAYDLLLDRLPWTISIVQMAWMRQRLYTEWTVR